MKFGLGQPVRRHEDFRLIRGQGRYTDDIVLPQMAHAYVLRSPIAHAVIKRIDASAARKMPGVLFVGSGEDVRADGLGDVRIHCLPSPKLHVPPIRAASSFGSTGHGPTGVTPLMNEFIAAHLDLTDTPCHVRTLIDTVAPSAYA